MNFCIFDVITYSLAKEKYTSQSVVIWWIFVSLMWLHTARQNRQNGCRQLWFDEFLYLWCDYIQQAMFVLLTSKGCDLMNFCIFDVITYSIQSQLLGTDFVVIWWIFVSLMWLHTAMNDNNNAVNALWFDEFLYLWCDYIQHYEVKNLQHKCCDLMNFCIFDVITYSCS